MATMYCAEIEVDRRRVEQEQLDAVVGALEQYHPAAGVSARGLLTVAVSFPASSLDQAATTALAVAQLAAQATPRRLEVMTEEEFNARQGFEALPDLIGATEAARLLGVTRQRVQQLVDTGKLPAQLIGRSLVLSRATVQSYASVAEGGPSKPAGEVDP